MDASNDSLQTDSSDVERLKQEFSFEYQVASVQPETVNLMNLWQLIEPYLERLSDAEQLRLISFVITQLADLHTMKADRLLADWQDQHNDEGPVLELDWLQGLVQRTMHLDLTDLVKPKVRKVASNQSVVGVVEKKKVLEMVESIEVEEETKQNALSVAHDENVSLWISTICYWLQSCGEEKVSLIELTKGTKLSLVKVWLALLLGNYHLEPEDEFYSKGKIWIYGVNKK